MASIGFGKYARPEFDLGLEDEIVNPPARCCASSCGRKTPDGFIQRTWEGGPPKGENMGRVPRIEASQKGEPLALRINYDKVIWSGLSWGVAEVDAFAPEVPLNIHCTSAGKDEIKPEAKAYSVQYRP